MKVFQRFVLPFLSGILLYAAWPMSPLPFLIFFALVPLLYLETITKSNWRFFYLLYINFFIWNIATTWWIWNASPGGAAGAIAANSLLMTIPWLLFRFTKKQLGNGLGYTSLILYWLTFEFIHHNWDLSWPWLTLGNVFANSPRWIQWYSYTGTTGGSLWVLLVNVLLFTNLPSEQFASSEGKFSKVRSSLFRYSFASSIILITATVLVPIIISFLSNPGSVFGKDTSIESSPNIILAQPNIDPYNEKFSGNTTEQ